MIIFKCPYCDTYIEVCKNEINCNIFRHGAWKNNGIGIPPHSSEININKWLIDDMIYGCGKPFKLINGEAVKIGYI